MNLIEKQFHTSSGVRLHFRDSGAQPGKRPLLLLHSLSDNGHVFDAIITAGLEESFRLIIPNGRGRGKSERPESSYTLQEHAEDLLELLDELAVEQAIVAGHSFGGLLGLYFAARYGHRVAGLTLIDAAINFNVLTPAFLLVMTDRLGKWYPSKASYLGSVRAVPFMTYWEETMQATFLADIVELSDGSVYVATQRRHIAKAAAHIMLQSENDWRRRALAYTGPALVLQATQPFLMGQQICEEQKALETAVLLAGGELHRITGNHFTMLYGSGARQIAAAIRQVFAVDTAVVAV